MLSFLSENVPFHIAALNYITFFGSIAALAALAIVAIKPKKVPMKEKSK